MKCRIGTVITVSDDSNYRWETSCNGGDYGFWTTFQKVGNDQWEVTYGTTADFAYCEFGCGFQECDSCCNRDSEFCSPEIVPFTEVVKEVVRAVNMHDSESYYVTYRR